MKSKKTDDWILVKEKFNSKIHEALLVQHHAVQFLALTAKYLLEEKKDDSHTNMEFSHELEGFIGNELSNQTRLFLNSIDLKLQLIDSESKILSEIEMPGKTRIGVFTELQQLLIENDLDGNKLKNELHYSIPEHQLDQGGEFEIKDRYAFQLNNSYRHNAGIILNQIVRKFNLETKIRVWPHHFDTGAFVPTSFQPGGELSQYIGLGFAVPDSMVNEPYFYLSFWSAENIKELEQPDSIAHGYWMMPAWGGAVLKISDLVEHKEAIRQHQMVYEFFESGLEILRPHFNLNYR